MTAINEFLLQNGLRIAKNPCISPDFCLDWPSLRERLLSGAGLTRYARSNTETAFGSFSVLEDEMGDHAWLLRPSSERRALDALSNGVELPSGEVAFPATWENLLRMKNLLQEHDADSTVFPSASGNLAQSSLGVGARFTTLHWPAVEWTMAALNLSMTANQNSIPRELVYDVDVMLAGRLEGVAFPFIGCDVPEGHQGQSVEGMSHGAVLSKLKTGFHHKKLPWGFNADHQPIGGKFDGREAALVRGCLLASYITFDLSPELSATSKPSDTRVWCSNNVPSTVTEHVRTRLSRLNLASSEQALADLLAAVWPAMLKMQRRDRLYAAARREAFTSAAGQRYFRELSIDELPGLTSQETLATMLAICEALEIGIQYVAPAFGFQKNFPFDDDAELERRVTQAFRVCEAFGVSIGFHSGSGKSAKNYEICGRVTKTRMEVKTSGRYTYEMGRALAGSSDPTDRQLFEDWYRFTRELALSSAFGANADERELARRFIADALAREGRATDVFADRSTCEDALDALAPNPDHMFWFEYNFLFVLAAGGRAEKSALGDHGKAGYDQRARFYALSLEGQLRYAKNVSEYLCFLAETTGMASRDVCAAARARLSTYRRYDELLADIPNL